MGGELGIRSSLATLLLFRFFILDFEQLLFSLFNLKVLLDLGAMIKVSVEHFVRLLRDQSVVLVNEDGLHDLLVKDEEVLRPALGLLQFFFVHLLNFGTLHHIRMLVTARFMRGIRFVAARVLVLFDLA